MVRSGSKKELSSMRDCWASKDWTLLLQPKELRVLVFNVYGPLKGNPLKHLQLA